MAGRSTREDMITRWVIAGLSVFVVAAVAVLVLRARTPATRAASASVLPTINALLNGTSAVLLSIGYVCIRRRKILAHRTCMVSAFAVSTLFLVTYVMHHYQVGSVRFAGQGWVRLVYFSVLIPHVMLSAVVVPLALTTITYGWRSRFDRHVRIARWTLPIWLYVSVSGVVVYGMLYHLY